MDISQYLVNFADIPYERKSIERVLTGIQDLDYYFKGLETGITEILGDTNAGKSVLVSGFINKAIEQGYTVGVFAGEHSLIGYKNLVMQQGGAKGHFELVPFMDNNGNETNIADWYVDEETEKRLNKKYNDNLFLFNVEKDERDIDTILKAVIHGKQKYGIRFWIFDNLMEIRNDNENQWQEQTSIGTKMRNVFVNNDMFCVLVMHTNKSDTLRITTRNAFGSSNITNKGYRIGVLYRKDYVFAKKGQEKELEKIKQDLAKAGFDYDKCDGWIDIIKSKGNGNGIVGLVYDGDTKSYKQAPKISKTEADRIYKAIEKKNKKPTLTDWEDLTDEDNPFD